jgi:hypothetical protein
VGLLQEVGDLEQLERLLQEICDSSGHSPGTMLQAICSPDTPLEVLTTIRSTAKRLVLAAQGPMHKAAATLLYQLSIASAFERYGRNISSKDPTERLELWKELASELSDNELADIFERAVAALLSPS